MEFRALLDDGGGLSAAPARTNLYSSTAKKWRQKIPISNRTTNIRKKREPVCFAADLDFFSISGYGQGKAARDKMQGKKWCARGDPVPR